MNELELICYVLSNCFNCHLQRGGQFRSFQGKGANEPVLDQEATRSVTRKPPLVPFSSSRLESSKSSTEVGHSNLSTVDDDDYYSNNASNFSVIDNYDLYRSLQNF